MDLEEVDGENVAENSDHDEVLDAAITYKIDATYPSNSLKDRKWQFEKEQNDSKSIKENCFS